MNSWFFLLVAVAGNIGANISFKYFVRNTKFERDSASVANALLQPSLWIGVLLGVMLLGCYLVAIRTIPIGVAYSVATGLSIAGVTCAGALLYGELVSLRALMGIAVVFLGVTLITTG